MIDKQIIYLKTVIFLSEQQLHSKLFLKLLFYLIVLILNSYTVNTIYLSDYKLISVMALNDEVLIMNYTVNKRKVIILAVFSVVVILGVVLLSVSLNNSSGGNKSSSNTVESKIGE